MTLLLARWARPEGVRRWRWLVGGSRGDLEGGSATDDEREGGGLGLLSSQGQRQSKAERRIWGMMVLDKS